MKNKIRKITAIIQARMGSDRLPNKTLLEINNIPIIEWVFRRLSMSKEISQIVFAIPNSRENDVLLRHLESMNAIIFRGSEHDVLDRFYQASVKYEAKIIVRVCADNPFIDAHEVDKAIRFFQSGNYDYVYNHIPKNNLYPDGIGAEVTDISTLEIINKNAISKDHREHVFNYVWSNQSLFTIGTFNPHKKWLSRPDMKLDIDTYQDYQKYMKLKLLPESKLKSIMNYIDEQNYSSEK